jgi:hypothetical protein
MDLIATDQSYTAILTEKQLDVLTIIVTSDYPNVAALATDYTTGNFLFAHMATYGSTSS